jgi:SPP1 family predicted phage head-tail adaptor
MIIGKSDRRIIVQRATVTTNGYGEPVSSWATLITIWAELLKQTGLAERIQSDQDSATKMLSFKVRRSTDSRGVTTDDRITYDGLTYDIHGIEEVGRTELIFHGTLIDTIY